MRQEQQRSTMRTTRRQRRQDRRAVHGVEARLRLEGGSPPQDRRPHRRPRRLTGRDGRSQFCAGLLRLVLVSYTDAAGAGPAEATGASDGKTLERAVQQIARKGMRLMLLERTARQGWDRRRGR